MSSERPEYVVCIQGRQGQGLCGRWLGWEFRFIDRAHWELSAEVGSRLELCLGCAAVLEIERER